MKILFFLCTDLPDKHCLGLL